MFRISHWVPSIVRLQIRQDGPEKPLSRFAIFSDFFQERGCGGLQTAHGDGQLSFDGAWGDVECRGDLPVAHAVLLGQLEDDAAAFGELFHSVGQRAVQQLEVNRLVRRDRRIDADLQLYLCKAGHTVPVAAQQVVGTTVAHGAVDIGIEVFDAAEHSAAFPQLKKEIGDDVFGRLLLVQIHTCELEKPVVIVQVELLECHFVPFGDLPENVVERYLCTFFCHGSALMHT